MSTEPPTSGPPASPPAPAVPLRQRLRDALTVALRSRDRVALAVLRPTLAAIDNAEAVHQPPSVGGGAAIEQIPVGAGATEAERRVLTEAQVEGIVRAELAERRTAARTYDLAGRGERAERLRTEIAVLARYLPDGTPADAPLPRSG